MKCLTIHQPWAELIARGDKRVENRVWPTDYRGLLAIHAGKSDSRLHQCLPFEINPKAVAFGAIVAVAKLVACLRLDTIRSGAIDGLEWVVDHQFTEGPYCWCLIQAVRVSPEIPLRGQQGLFDLPPELRDVLTRRWQAGVRESSAEAPSRLITLDET